MTDIPLPHLVFPADRVLEVIDSHTCGQPTRVVIGGAGIPPGTDPEAARAEMARERDWIRRVAVLEPRGHRSMFVAALIAPGGDTADYGVVFMDASGYPDMCGHATIGLATTLCETGLVGPGDKDFSGPFEFGLRTPAGRLSLRASFRDGRCTAIAFRTPLAYYLGRIALALGPGAPTQVDIAYGGQWYAFVPVPAGLAIEPDCIDALIAAAAPVRAAIAAQNALVDPRSGNVPEIGNIVWTADPGGGADALNVPVSSSNSFDRSPCGTATCARMATLVARGGLAIGQPFVNQGIMGTLYTGVAVARHEAGALAGIVPEVEGSAWITARAQLRVDARDPLGQGYLIGNGAAVL